MYSKARDFLSSDSNVRSALAFTVTGLGIVALWVVSWVTLNNAGTEDKGEAARLVFASIVPLFGTWVGSVLAYYFTSQNLRAGSETALAAVTALDRQSANTPVQKVMTPPTRIFPRKNVPNDDAAKALVLGELHQAMDNAGRSRVPILTDGQAPVALYVLHISDIEKYAGSLVPVVAPAAVTATLGELLNSPVADFKALTSFAVVPETATLADARTALRSSDGAKDVFVTTGGVKTGEVLGWLTNSDLAKTE